MGLLIAFADVLMLCTHSPYDKVTDSPVWVEYKEKKKKKKKLIETSYSQITSDGTTPNITFWHCPVI